MQRLSLVVQDGLVDHRIASINTSDHVSCNQSLCGCEASESLPVEEKTRVSFILQDSSTTFSQAYRVVQLVTGHQSTHRHCRHRCESITRRPKWSRKILTSLQV
ncbi:uncharacterized protein LOC112680091 [Sipha flava]|uniref:Uncharacterized protein LOC112680091 n=1 Tax=Sipha flava TaxID=143950 RepID=A0A8B8F593_9HEMI|nr:uncharacterized protein LOC112680091 [Sipha flava]